MKLHKIVGMSKTSVWRKWVCCETESWENKQQHQNDLIGINSM